MNIYNKHNPPSGYYVYIYLRKNNLTPYYVGKGKNARAWDKDHKVLVPADSGRIIILEQNLTNIGALALERRYIKWYGRKDNKTGILRNLTDGGEGATNRLWTVQEKEKMSAVHKGRKRSEEFKQKQRNRKGIRHCSEETKNKISIAKQGNQVRLGQTHSEETKNKISIANRGKQSRLGQTHSEETKNKIKLARKRQVISDETKTKISNAVKQFRAKKKATE